MVRKKIGRSAKDSKGLKANATADEELFSLPTTTLETRKHSLSAAILSSRAGNCPRISQDECEVICEDILDSSNMGEALCDYLDLSAQEANDLLKEAFGNDSSSVEENCRSDSTGNESDRIEDDDDDDDDDDGSLLSIDSADDYIKEGECELCEREMKLTLHHLIPKCTWKHIKPRFLEAADYYRKGNMDKVKKILGLGEELPFGVSSKTFKSGIAVKLWLASYTASMCAPCHKCVHKHHDNMELAEKYNTIDKILEDERIFRFCQWQSKQKVGKYSLKIR